MVFKEQKMQIERFEPSLNEEFLKAVSDDGAVGIIQLTLFASAQNRNDEYFLGIANCVLDKVQQLQSSIQVSFLGATRMDKAFPSLAFSFRNNADAHKLHGALAVHFIDHPHGGYDIRYSEINCE